MLLLSTEIYVVTFLLTVVISIFVLFNNHKSRVNLFFSLLGFSIGLWILCNIIINLAYEPNFSLLFARISIIWVALMPILFNQFIKSLYFPKDIKYERFDRLFRYISYVAILVIISLSQTDYNVINITFESWGVDYTPGTLYGVLLVYMLTVFGFSLYHLFKIARKLESYNSHQARFILIGASTTVILSIFTNIVSPFIGYGFLSTFGPITVLIFLSFIAYSITRHHLFNIRVIAIELVTFALWIIMLARTLLADTGQGALIEGGMLVITVIFGTLLIRSTFNEIKQREQIKKLSDELQNTYARVGKADEKISQGPEN